MRQNFHSRSVPHLMGLGIWLRLRRCRARLAGSNDVLVRLNVACVPVIITACFLMSVVQRLKSKVHSWCRLERLPARQSDRQRTCLMICIIEASNTSSYVPVNITLLWVLILFNDKLLSNGHLQIDSILYLLRFPIYHSLTFIQNRFRLNEKVLLVNFSPDLVH